MLPIFSAPESISHSHDLSNFDCGNDSLNSWLRGRALKNESMGASRTYVVSRERRVVAYYSLAYSNVTADNAPGSLRRNMPDPIPMMLLARLAVDKDHQGNKLGSSLLKDAVKRSVYAGKIAGLKGLMVHAINEEAVKFYKHFGFVTSHLDSKLLLMSLHQFNFETP